MTVIFYVYARTSISAAKRNAQRHREADGGQINWANENRRLHGQMDRPDGGDTGPARGLVEEVKAQIKGEKIIEQDKGPK